jgi:ribosomal-protein-alanine N-acetyltransferase
MSVMGTAFDPLWREAWNRRQVEDALAFPATNYVLMDSEGNAPAESGSPAAGFALTRYAPGEEELLLIAVTPLHRRQGLGELLINRLKIEARARGASRIYLEMRHNNPAERLYRKVGFEPIGKRPDYYQSIDGTRIDAITFGLSV